MQTVVSGQARGQEAQDDSRRTVTEGSAPDQPEPDVEIRRILIGFPPDSISHIAYLDLDPVEAGKKYRLDFTLRNTLSVPLRMKSATVSCGCSQLRVRQGIVQPGLQVDGQIRFTAPSSSPAGIFALAIEFFDDPLEGMTGRVTLRFPLRGMLDLGIANGEIVEVPPDGSPVCLPVLFTAPVAVDRLAVETSSDLRDLVMAVVPDSSCACIQVTATPAVVGESGVAGTVTLVDRDSGRRVERYVTFRARSAVRVSPLMLRFRRASPDDQEWVANGLVAVGAEYAGATPSGPHLSGDAPEGEKEPRPVTPREKLLSISLLCKNEPMNLSVKPLGESGVFRVSVRCSHQQRLDLEAIRPARAGADGDPPLVWEVVTVDGRFQFPAMFMFSD